MSEFKYWVRPGTLLGKSQAETFAEFQTAMKEFGEVCQLRIDQTNNRKQAYFRFFITTDKAIRDSRRDGQSVLGQAYPSGEIWLNSERPVGKETIKHEMLHTPRMGAWKHDPNVQCTMGQSGTNRYFCVHEVRHLQRMFGVPSKTFWPKDRGYWGARMRALLAEWEELKENRNRETNKAIRADWHRKVLANVTKQRTIAKEWFAAHERWRGVPGAGGY